MSEQHPTDGGDMEDLERLDVHAWAKEAARASILEDLTAETRELKGVIGDLAGGLREFAATTASQEDLVKATRALERSRRFNNLLLALPLAILVVLSLFVVRQQSRTADNTDKLEQIATSNRERNKTNSDLLAEVKGALDPNGETQRRGAQRTLAILLAVINDNRAVHGVAPLTSEEIGRLLTAPAP